jgi:hypothetical protein
MVVMDMSGDYRYSKLSEPDSIRLLLLQPASDLGAQVQCQLISTTLTECSEDLVEKYTALSYVWGDASDTVEALVDGQSLSITNSLETTLRHIRSPSRVFRVWAYAICINQEDVDERNQQVRQMAEVYQCAHHTILYFGTESSEAEQLLDFLRVSSRKISCAAGTPPMSGSDMMLAERYILTRPWLHRIWILQELVMSRDPWIQCNRSRAKWDHVREHLTYIYTLTGVRLNGEDPDPATRLSVEEFAGFMLLEKMANFRSEHQTPSFNQEKRAYKRLLSILKSRRGLGVADKRDMLFTHLTLAGVPHEEASGMFQDVIRVDYEKDWTKVFEDLARYLIIKQKDLRIMAFVEDVDLEERQLASWAVNWTSPRHEYPWLSIGI